MTQPTATNGNRTGRDGDRNRWLLVVAAGLVVFMATLDASIVNVGLPVIEQDFGVGTGLSQWVILGYLLPLVALTLPSGRWLDRVGTRAAFLLGVAGFAVTSLLVGAANGIVWLIAARAAQGAFAAVLFALLPVVTTTAVRPESRARAMALSSTVGPLGSVSGPVVGGFVIDAWGWPWMFWINLPMAAVILIIILTQMRPGRGLRVPTASWYGEAALFAIATSAVLVSFTLAAQQHVTWLLLALAAVPPMYVWRRLRSSEPVLRTIRIPNIARTETALIGSSIANGAVLFLLPFFLIQQVGVSASVTGLAVLAFPVGSVLLSPVGGVLADAWGTARTSLLGAVILVAGLSLLVPLGPSWEPVDLGWRLGVAGVGMGLFYGPNMALMMSSAPREQMGFVGATSSLVRQLGFSLGPTLATAAWAVGGYTVGGMRLGLAVAVAAALLPVLALAVGRHAPVRSGARRRPAPKR